MGVRFRAAIGPQHSAFDNPDVVGFSREGRADVPGTGCAVILSDRRAAEKTGSSHFGVWGVVLAWGRGLPDD